VISRALPLSQSLPIPAVVMDESDALRAQDDDQVIRLLAPRTRIETEEALDELDR